MAPSIWRREIERRRRENRTLLYVDLCYEMELGVEDRGLHRAVAAQERAEDRWPKACYECGGAPEPGFGTCRGCGSYVSSLY